MLDNGDVELTLGDKRASAGGWYMEHRVADGVVAGGHPLQEQTDSDELSKFMRV